MRQFNIDVDGIAGRCWSAGSGPPLILLHGSGPGAATASTWSRVVPYLSERFTVFATDLIGFGLSERKSSPPFFDTDLWLEQISHLIDATDSGSVGLIGHSLSGALALRIAARDRRIAALLTSATMGASFPAGPLGQCWVRPRSPEDIRRTMALMMHDVGELPAEAIEQRFATLEESGLGAHFEAMFQGDPQTFVDGAAVSAEELAEIVCPVLMVHGRTDRIVPAEPTSIAIAGHLAQADLLLLSRCGHLPPTERSGAFLGAALAFFGEHLGPDSPTVSGER